MQRFRSSSFDVSKVESVQADRRDRRIARDHKAIAQILSVVDTTDRPNLKFEIDVLLDPVNFRANWFAIASHLRHVPDLATSRGLELGSSVGTKLLIMQRLGAGEIVGCDYASHLIDDGLHWIASTGTKGIELIANTEQTVPFGDGEFDWVSLQMVYCQLNDAAIDPLLAGMYRVLRPGGLALVHDGANPLHPPTADAMRTYYREVELGDGTADAPSGPLFVTRRAVAASEAPQLDSASLDLLARNTAYMREADVRRAVQTFVETGATPTSPFRDDPDRLEPPLMLDGQAVRRPTDPFEMSRRFADAGFEVEQRDGYLGGVIGDLDDYVTTTPSVFLLARKS